MNPHVKIQFEINSQPTWGVVGGFIHSDGWHKITNIIFDEKRNSEVLLTETLFSGEDISTIVSSVFNLFNFEVYEFSVSFLGFNNKKVQVEIKNTDHIYLNETVLVKDFHEDTVLVEYYNEDNANNIFYNTGIRHYMRLSYQFIRGGFEDDNELNKADSNVIMINSELYETDTFEFYPQTKGTMRSTVAALSQSHVFINQERYLKNSVEIEPLKESNLYDVQATLIKASDRDIKRIADLIEALSDTSALLETGQGYVKL